MFELQVGMLSGDEECKAVNAIIFLSLTLPSVSPKESGGGGGFTHRAQPLGGLRLTLPSNVYMQAPVCLLRLFLLFSLSLFYIFPFLLALIYLLFSEQRFHKYSNKKKKKGTSQYGACIWKNQTQHSCSASPIVKARY